MKDLVEFIQSGIQQGKSIATLKKEAAKAGWSSKEISKAIKVAVDLELIEKQEKPVAINGKVENATITYD